MNKAAAQRSHAKRRAQERYGLDVNRHTLRAWALQIQAGKATKLEQQSHRVGKYLIMHDGLEVIVIYDRARKTIVTCLPQKEENAEQHPRPELPEA